MTERERDGADTSVSDAALVRKIGLRLIPFLLLLYVVAYLDRVNVGFAKLDMEHVPWFNPAVFATGAGIFFLGYFLFEVPSNLILEKVGARLWIARIMVTWGVISMAMALSRSVSSFYSLRFLLGIAEAGFFPGVLLYLTYWFTAKERARVVALFMTANCIALSFGNPLSGWILDLTRGHGPLQSWQWLFVLEGIPALLLGAVVLFYLPNGPRAAGWLTSAEKDRVEQRISREWGDRRNHSHDQDLLKQVVGDSRVWICCATFFLLVFGMYGITMWMPQIVQNLIGKDAPRLHTGLLSAIPYFVAGFVMVGNAWHSDRTGERRLHIMVPATIGAAGMACSAIPHLPTWAALLFMTIGTSGMWSIQGPFWSIAPGFLRGSAIAAGIAFINSVGNLAGFAGPKLVDVVKTSPDDFTRPLLMLAFAALAGGLCALATPKPQTVAERPFAE